MNSRFSWKRNGKFFNIGSNPTVTMRKRSGTLEIGIRLGERPEDYEGEYQCFARNDHGMAMSNKILLRVSSKDSDTFMPPSNNYAAFIQNNKTKFY